MGTILKLCKTVGKIETKTVYNFHKDMADFAILRILLSVIGFVLFWTNYFLIWIYLVN